MHTKLQLRWKGKHSQRDYPHFQSNHDFFYSFSRSDHLFELNYAITLYNHDEIEAAKVHFTQFEKLFQELDDSEKNADPTVLEKRQKLASLLGM